MNVMGRVGSGVVLSVAAALGLLAPVFLPRSEGAPGSALERRCESGKAGSCTQLGLAHLNGTGGGRDSARAYSFFEKGCAGGDLDGCVEQGLLLLDGDGAAKDEAHAATLFRDACDKRFARACSALGSLYESGQGVKADTAVAVALYQRACTQGFGRACTTLGWRVSFDSDAGPADGERAIQLFEQGCKAGDLLACRREAQAYQCARGVPADLKRAGELFHASCRMGDAASCEWLASYLADGTGGVERFASEHGFRALQLQAAIEAARFGRRTRAEELLEQVEHSAPEKKPQVKFARACLALDSGDVAGAEALLTGLPDDPGLRVLRRLIQLRRDGTTEWSAAMVSAWVAEARPDLRASLFLPSSRELEMDIGQCMPPRTRPSPPPGMEPAMAFLLEFSDTVARSSSLPVSDALVARALVLTRDTRSEVRMVALSVLTQPSLTEAQRQKLQPEVEAHLARLAREHPGSLFFQLQDTMGLSKDGPPLTAALVDRLEAMAGLPFDPPLRDVHAAFRAAHAAVGEGPESAFNATVSVFMAPASLILTNWDEKARNAEPALRKRLGRVLVALGRRISEGPWLVHAFQGTALMKRGAALMGSPEEANGTTALRERARRYYQGVSTMRAMGSWPLPAFTEDWLERVSTQEMTFYSDLSQRGAW